jgi:protease IV
VSRRSLITALVVGTVALMTLAGLMLAVAGGTAGLGMGGRIAVIEVDGMITDDQAFLRDVRRLRNDRSVRGWVVAINSPGGTVAPAQSMYQTLVRIRAEDQVPVIASIGTVGASGGYYVALGADSILVLPGSITGSIGVLMQYPNLQGLMERLGVRMEVVKGGEQKDLATPFREMDPAHREILEALVADVHDQFVEAVVEARSLTTDQVRAVADGRVLSGRQAHTVGLVDRMGNRDEAVSLAGVMAGLGASPRVVRPPRRRGPWLLELLLGTSVATAVRDLTGTMTDGAWPAVLYMLH